MVYVFYPDFFVGIINYFVATMKVKFRKNLVEQNMFGKYEFQLSADQTWMDLKICNSPTKSPATMP